MTKKRPRLHTLMNGVLRERKLDVFYKDTKVARATAKCSDSGPKVQVLILDDGREIGVYAEAGWIDRSRHQDIIITLEKNVSSTLRRGGILVARDGTIVVNDSAKPRTVPELITCLDTVVLVGGDVTKFLADMLEMPSLRCDPDAAFRHFATQIAGGRSLRGDSQDQQDQDEDAAELVPARVN